MQQWVGSLVKNVFSKVEARTFLRSARRLQPIISHPIYRHVLAEISPWRGQISEVSTRSDARDCELFSSERRKAPCKTGRDTTYFSILRFTLTNGGFSIIYTDNKIHCYLYMVMCFLWQITKKRKQMKTWSKQVKKDSFLPSLFIHILAI